MKFGLDVATTGVYADPHKLVDLAVEAERAGWDGFFIFDVLLNHEGEAEPILDPWITLGAIALQTRRIKIGAFVTPLPRRRPWKVARETVTLDHLSRGRLIFGAGLGFEPRDFTVFGEEADPKVRAEKLEEGLEIVTRLWQGESLSFQGQHYQVDKVTMLPRPLQSPRIPVWLAGGWPRRQPLRRATHWDGIYLMTVNQETNEMLTAAEVAEITAYLRAHGAGVKSFDIAVNIDAPSDPAQAAEVIRPYAEAGATWYMALSPDTPEEYRERIRSGPPKM